jgi:hypothetical protein
MANVTQEFVLSADAWDWLDENGFLMSGDELVKLDGKERHLFDFMHSDGRTARLLLSRGEDDSAEVRVFQARPGFLQAQR